jgi:hypothetical protein
MNSRVRWTNVENEALEEGVRKYGWNWGKITKEYGPDGNKLLSARVGGNKIAAKARAIAKKRYDNGEDVGIFTCLLTDTLIANKKKVVKKEKKEFEEWTDEQDRMLLEGFDKFKNDYKRISIEYPKLQNQYSGMRFRDRILMLQRKAIKNGDIPDVLVPGKEKILEIPLYKNNKMFITCPTCSRDIYEDVLMIDGLQCQCGIEPRLLGKGLDKYPWIVYIISKEGNELLDQVEYVGVTDNLFKRLYCHSKWMTEGEYRIRISLRIGERRCIQIFKPIRNAKKNVSKDESYEYRVNMETCIWREYDIIRRINFYDEYKHITNLDIFSRDTIGVSGIVFGVLREIDETWCYLEGVDICECSIPCRIQGEWNTFRNLPRYYPHDQQDIKKYAGTSNEQDIDFEIGLPCERNERFISECVRRNQKITDSTKDTYTQTMMTLCSHGFITECMHPENFIMKLRDIYTLNTIAKLLACINVFFRNCTPKEKKIIIGNDWIRIRNIFLQITKLERLKVDAIVDKQEKSIREVANWIDLPDLISKFDDYFQTKPTPESRQYQAYLMAFMHLKQASIRNDYRTLKLFEYDVEKDNYIDWDNGKIVFNRYKNCKHMGRIVHDISDTVYAEISTMRKLRESENCNLLFINTKKEEMSSAAYSIMLSSLFEKITTKNIGSQMLRKITVSYERRNELTPSQNSNLSNLMMHNENTSKRTYRKI